MRTIPFILAGLLFLALAELPIGYFTFLRIVTFLAAIILAIHEAGNGINFWVIAFSLVAILFNPIIPIYLHDNEAWAPLDVMAGMLFLVKGVWWATSHKRTTNQNYKK